MAETFGNMSLYAKLRDGRYTREFPPDFFAEVEFCDGIPSIPTYRWKKINALETFYEWTIFFTRDFEIVEDYMNGACKFHPNWYMFRFRSRQNSVLDIEYDSIYDLLSSEYNPVNIDINSLQQTDKSRYSVVANPQWRFRGGDQVIRQENKDIRTYQVPVSLTLNANPNFAAILDKVRTQQIPLPIPANPSANVQPSVY